MIKTHRKRHLIFWLLATPLSIWILYFSNKIDQQPIVNTTELPAQSQIAELP